jgi:hypothetical protein
LLPTFIQWSACWVLPTRSAARNDEGCYTVTTHLIHVVETVLSNYLRMNQSERNNYENIYFRCLENWRVTYRVRKFHSSGIDGVISLNIWDGQR